MIFAFERKKLLKSFLLLNYCYFILSEILTVSLDSSEEQLQPGLGQNIPTTVAPVEVYWSSGITEGFTALSFKRIQVRNSSELVTWSRVVKVLSYTVGAKANRQEAQLTLVQNGKCHN